MVNGGNARFWAKRKFVLERIQSKRVQPSSRGGLGRRGDPEAMTAAYALDCFASLAMTATPLSLKTL
jgi:hypothetical protein